MKSRRKKLRIGAYAKSMGTPPRQKTIRRLRAQMASGMPTLCKLAIRHGMFIHPTKGWRTTAGTPTTKRRKRQGVLRQMIAVLVGKQPERPIKPRRERPEHAAHVDRMTNWQRCQWARAGYPKKRAEEFSSLRRPA